MNKYIVLTLRSGKQITLNLAEITNVQASKDEDNKGGSRLLFKSGATLEVSQRPSEVLALMGN